MENRWLTEVAKWGFGRARPVETEVASASPGGIICEQPVPAVQSSVPSVACMDPPQDVEKMLISALNLSILPNDGEMPMALTKSAENSTSSNENAQEFPKGAENTENYEELPELGNSPHEVQFAEIQSQFASEMPPRGPLSAEKANVGDNNTPWGQLSSNLGQTAENEAYWGQKWLEEHQMSLRQAFWGAMEPDIPEIPKVELKIPLSFNLATENPQIDVQGPKSHNTSQIPPKFPEILPPMGREMGGNTKGVQEIARETRLAMQNPQIAIQGPNSQNTGQNFPMDALGQNSPKIPQILPPVGREMGGNAKSAQESALEVRLATQNPQIVAQGPNSQNTGQNSPMDALGQNSPEIPQSLPTMGREMCENDKSAQEFGLEAQSARQNPILALGSNIWPEKSQNPQEMGLESQMARQNPNLALGSNIRYEKSQNPQEMGLESQMARQKSNLALEPNIWYEKSQNAQEFALNAKMGHQIHNLALGSEN